MPVYPFPEEATLLSRGVTGEDSDGNDVYGDTETPVLGAFSPAGSTELIQGEDVVIANPSFYLNDGEPVPAPTDRLRVRGVVYEIDGQPLDYRNPYTGEEPGAVLRLERAT